MGDALEVKPADVAVEALDPEPQGSSPNRLDLPFIEQLKRREELLNAGFVASQPRAVNQETMEKDVVIVLPKEAFRYEADKQTETGIQKEALSDSGSRLLNSRFAQ